MRFHRIRTDARPSLHGSPLIEKFAIGNKQETMFVYSPVKVLRSYSIENVWIGNNVGIKVALLFVCFNNTILSPEQNLWHHNIKEALPPLSDRYSRRLWRYYSMTISIVIENWINHRIRRFRLLRIANRLSLHWRTDFLRRKADRLKACPYTGVLW